MALNLTGLGLAIAGVWVYPRQYTGAFVLGNLLTAILMRNELFGRFLYLVVNTLFAKVGTRNCMLSIELIYRVQWTPLKFRLGCTSVLQHLGGIHSGCATSGFLWLIFRVATILINHRSNHEAVLVLGVLTNILVGISIASAFPWVRNTHHKYAPSPHPLIGRHSNYASTASLNVITASWDGMLQFLRMRLCHCLISPAQ